MNKDDHLQRHLELCQRIYLRMRAEGSWPWPDEADSPNPEDLVDSKSTEKDL